MAESEEHVSNTTDDSSGEDESGSDAVELLVTGRERRKTAGNRYDRDMVLDQVGDDDEPDEVALLFADNEEDQEDDEFKSSEPDDDAEMSSDDDDDQGPNAAPDDMDGEKELEKQAKSERAKKRKAELTLTSTAGLRKRPKIMSQRSEKVPLPAQLAKKKDKANWLSGTASSSGRTSLRKQTIAHREITMARIRENEAQTAKSRALKEQRQKERSKEVVHELTQADRLAEAERVERRNAKSLNRWEAMEKKRAEEQAAKLAALKNRKLEGPVITWWSGKSMWTSIQHEESNPSKPAMNLDSKPEPKKRGRKPKGFWEQLAAAKEAEQKKLLETASPRPEASGPPSEIGSNVNETGILETNNEKSRKLSTSSQVLLPESTFLLGIEEYSQPQHDVSQNDDANKEAADSSTAAMEENAASGQPMTPSIDVLDNETSKDPARQPSSRSPEGQLSDANNTISRPDMNTRPNEHTDINLHSSTSVVEPTTRNLIILEKFDGLSNDSRHDFSVFYHNRKANKAPKHAFEICAITGLPIRYKDPLTGLGYANMAGYKKLQDLRQHSFAWSSMLGCYVGRVGHVAHGVPAGFAGD